MRITNSMMTNRMILNIEKNANKTNGLYTQLSTGKKIQFASEDPILASRSLKFRTTIDKNLQYRDNVDQGTSWMEVSETGLKNVNDIMKKIRELSVQGASDSYSYDDRKKIVTEISSLTDQLGVEMNINYAGRYVFSGFRTDRPATFTEAQDPAISYAIQQNFNTNDLQNTFGYEKEVQLPNFDSKITQVNCIKLPYTDVTSLSISGIAVNTVSINDGSTAMVDAYNPTAGANYIKETGEIIFSDADLAVFKSNPNTVVSYTKDNLKKGELNPEVYFTCTKVGGTNPGPYNMDAQTIELEFSTNTKLGINTLAKDVITDKLYADLHVFNNFINRVTLPTIDEIKANDPSLTDDQAASVQTLQKQEIQRIFNDRFSDLIEQLDNHSKQISKEHADLGSRMNRLELIGNRLDEDELTFKTLLSQNEDVDYMTAIMELNSAESVYQAAMQVGANIMQVTLANYI